MHASSGRKRLTDIILHASTAGALAPAIVFPLSSLADRRGSPRHGDASMLRRLAIACAIVAGACQDAPTTAPIAPSTPHAAVLAGSTSDLIPGQFIVTLR